MRQGRGRYVYAIRGEPDEGEAMTVNADFLAQDIDVHMTSDRSSAVLTIVIGDATCSVSLPRDRLKKLHDRIAKKLAEI
jgi:hypothetical protein